MNTTITASGPAVCKGHSARRNFWLHVTEGAFASFSGMLLSGGIILPILVKELGAEPYILGIMGSVGGLAVLAPLIFAPYIESIRKKKKLVLLLGIGQRLPLLFIALALWAYGFSSQDRTATYVCLIGIAFLNLGTGFIVSILVPPWMDLVAETITDTDKPRLFGYRNGLSSAMAVSSGAVVSWVLASVSFPNNFAVLFLAGFGIMMISLMLFALVNEMPCSYRPNKRQPARIYFRELFGVLKTDHVYRWFLTYQVINRIGIVALPYYAYVAVAVHHMNPALAAGAFIMIRQATNAVANFVFSEIAARLGNKPILIVGSLLHALAMILAAAAPNGSWFFAVFLVWGLAMAAKQVAGAPFVMAVAPRGRRVGYITLSQAILAPAGVIFPALAGWIIYAQNHELLFFITASLMILGIFPLLRCNPHDRTAMETMD